MSEPYPTTPGQIDPSANQDVLLRQQQAIRGMVDGRVQSTPAEDWRAAGVIGDLGLAEGQYNVFTDSEAPFGGGFVRVASKEDPAEVLEGLSWVHVGGPMNNPNSYVNTYALRPNGDIVGHVSVENNEGTQTHVYNLSANSSDPETAHRYQLSLSNMHYAAQRYMEAPAEKSQHPTAPETTHQPIRKGRLGGILGRFSLR